MTYPARNPAVSATGNSCPAPAEAAVALATTVEMTARPSAPPSWRLTLSSAEATP